MKIEVLERVGVAGLTSSLPKHDIRVKSSAKKSSGYQIYVGQSILSFFKIKTGNLLHFAKSGNDYYITADYLQTEGYLLRENQHKHYSCYFSNRALWANLKVGYYDIGEVFSDGGIDWYRLDFKRACTK